MIINLIKLLIKSLIIFFRSLYIKICFLLRLPVKPYFLNFILTYQCNSHCKMCNIWQKYRNRPELKKKELSLLDIKNFVKNNHNFLSKLKHIGITGGEPLLRKDIVNIIAVLHNWLPKVRLGIQTNGLNPILINKTLTQIKKIYPSISIAVSLDGLNKTHDSVRGTKNAYNNFLKTVKILKKLKIKDVTCGFTISDFNYKEILKTADFVESKLGYEFSCFLPEESGFYFENINSHCLNLKNDSLKKIVIQSLKKFRYHYFMDNLRRILEYSIKPSLPCYSGYTSITLDPYGNIRPCILRPEVFGNIKNKSLRDILFDYHGWQTRQKLKKCRCWCQCEVSTSAVIDFFDPLRWFIFHGDKIMFLKKMLSKIHRL